MGQQFLDRTKCTQLSVLSNTTAYYPNTQSYRWQTCPTSAVQCRSKAKTEYQKQNKHIIPNIKPKTTTSPLRGWGGGRGGGGWERERKREMTGSKWLIWMEWLGYCDHLYFFWEVEVVKRQCVCVCVWHFKTTICTVSVDSKHKMRGSRQGLWKWKDKLSFSVL